VLKTFSTLIMLLNLNCRPRGGRGSTDYQGREGSTDYQGRKGEHRKSVNKANCISRKKTFNKAN